ncbi:MAG TPA: zinc-dependent alcohol dehydrogenase family protein [Gammaproteobacteria bacterium]|nr:zinc-dependent alcohol dehydrogenase family protein [Gammaproteobacteria bacterium]
MQAIQLQSFGPPAEAVACVDLPNPDPPGPGEALIEVEACPINPADLLTLSGDYGRLPALPAIVGAEGVGRVRETGPDVDTVHAGDRVLLPRGEGAWRSLMKAPARDLFPLPADADPEQLAMLTVNPPTAYLLLHSVSALSPGAWVMQNAANSGVGRCVIRLARRVGLHTINLVRREALVDELRALGADAVVLDGEDLPARVDALEGVSPPALGLDAVGGGATDRLAACLAARGSLVSYGLMSGEPCRIDPKHLIFRGLTVRGFWLADWFRHAPRQSRMSLYRELLRGVAAGDLGAPVEARYPLERIREAVAHAARPGRNGKILLVPSASGA